MVFSMHSFAAITVQGKHVKIKEAGISLSQVIKQIEKQVSAEFVYKSEDLKAYRNLKVNEEGSVAQVLNAILKDTDLKLQVSDGIYLISKKTPQVKSDTAKTQEKKEIKGKVTDDQGVPLPGVSVVVKGTNIGVATDIDGYYSIELENNNTVLVFSFVGMLSKEVTYSGQEVINVILEMDTEQMSEVVVTGYQVISKERATGAFEKVTGEVLEQKISTNIMDKLEGQTTGVLFDKDGNIQIRGRSTLFADEDPLVVVDGFPIEGDIETVNPNDIESITILKDAAAASIWGARAANGVIVITSKKGSQKGKPRVEFSSSIAVSPKPDLYDLAVASTESLLEVEKFLAENNYTNLPSGRRQGAINQGSEAYLKLRDGIYTETEAEAVISKLRGVDVRDEFSDLFLRNSISQQYNLSVSGRGEKTAYYASINYNDNKSFSKGDDSDRIISKLNLENQLSDKLKVSVGIDATIRNSNPNGFDVGAVSSIPQYQTIIGDNGEYINQPLGYYSETKDNLVAQGYPYDWDYNLKREFDNMNNSSKFVDLKMQARINYNILKGLDIEGRYQYEWGDTKTRNLYNEETYVVRNLVNLYTVFDGGELVSNVPKGHQIYENNSNYKAFTARGQINFNRSFNDNKHNVTAIAGIEVRKTTSEGNSFKKYGYDPQTLNYVTVNLNERFPDAIYGRSRSLGDATNFTSKEDRFLSYYINAAYTFDEKYSITASARLDDSNLFGATSKYRNVPLWSIGGNWQISKEEFFTLDFVDRLTLRTTYGWNGNVNKSTSPYLIANATTDYWTQIPYAYPTNPKNPELRWEKTAVANFGLDFALLKNRLTGSIEYYDKYSDGVLGNVALNSTYGYSSALMNTAEISNRGVEVSLNGHVIDKAIKWTTGINFSYNKNKVEEVELRNELVSTYLSMSPKPGKPYSAMYSYRWAGLAEDGTPRIYDENGEKIDYDTKLEDASALKYEGSTAPKYYGSFINTIAYKGLSLRLLMTYKLGHIFRDNTIYYRGLDGTTGWVHEDYEERWQKAGDENITDVPKMPEDNSILRKYYDRYTEYGSHLVYDASHIRLQELILSYDLPSQLVKPLRMNKLRLGFQARNLGVIVFNDKGIDPENIPSLSGGISNKPQFTFSLNATF